MEYFGQNNVEDKPIEHSIIEYNSLFNYTLVFFAKNLGIFILLGVFAYFTIFPAFWINWGSSMVGEWTAIFGFFAKTSVQQQMSPFGGYENMAAAKPDVAKINMALQLFHMFCFAVSTALTVWFIAAATTFIIPMFKGKAVSVWMIFTSLKVFVPMLVIYLAISSPMLLYGLIGSSLPTTLSMFLWLIALGAYYVFIVKLSWAYYFVVDQNQEPAAALSSSWKYTSGNEVVLICCMLSVVVLLPTAGLLTFGAVISPLWQCYFGVGYFMMTGRLESRPA
ncbi:MAG: hypothetical protein ACRCUY_10530 [Thermoguttaceae bacterium]